MRRAVLASLIAVMLAVPIAGCGESAEESSDTPEATEAVTNLTIAAVETMLPPLEIVVEELSDTYDIEIVLFDKNVDAIRATQDGSADAALAVHKKFMEKFNEENNGTLIMIEPYAFYTGIGLYSDRYDSLDELPDGAQIAIANDPMNMDKGLRMIRDAGALELKEGVVGTYNILDIEENPRDFEFIDMDQIQTVRSLEDLDAAVVFFSHMANAGLDFESYMIRDQDAQDYPIAIVTVEDNAGTPWARDLAEALSSDAVSDEMVAVYGGVYSFY